MSNIVSLTEAKRRFSAILDRVSKGEEFVITRHDEMIAKLSPVKKPSFEQIKQTVEEIKKLSKGTKISLAEISAWKVATRKGLPLASLDGKLRDVAKKLGVKCLPAKL